MVTRTRFNTTFYIHRLVITLTSEYNRALYYSSLYRFLHSLNMSHDQMRLSICYKAPSIYTLRARWQHKQKWIQQAGSSGNACNLYLQVLVKILSSRPECPQWDSSWSFSVPQVKFRDGKISSSRTWPSLPTYISIHYSLPSDHSTLYIIVELPWESALSYETLPKYLLVYFDRYHSPDILSLKSTDYSM